MLQTSQAPANKPLLFGFSQPTYTSLWQAFDKYGFKELEQKQAIEFLLQKSGVPDTDTLLKTATSNPNELLLNIIKFVELTQQHFTIRTGSQERWDVNATEWMKNKDDQANILNALKILGITKEVKPATAEPDAICILGARNSIMRLRLDFANALYSKSELFAKELILLAGERYVTFDKNGISIDGTEQELKILAKKLGKEILNLTETDLIYSSYQQSPFFDKPAVVIDTPKRELPRPTTETTVMELIKWLKEHPQIKSITFVSNQPHIEYQKAVIDMVLNREHVATKIEVIGPEFSISETVDPTPYIKDLIGSLGSQIYAKTPSVVESLDLDVHNPDLTEQFLGIYQKQPLIYENAKSLFKMN